MYYCDILNISFLGSKTHIVEDGTEICIFLYLRFKLFKCKLLGQLSTRHLDNPFSIALFVLCVKKNLTDLISWDYLKPPCLAFFNGEDAVGNLKVQNKKL